jgi:hypothetical protein
VSRSVGGILSFEPLPAEWVIIHLSGLPGDIGRAGRPTFDLAPDGVYPAALVTRGTGALLPHRFTLTCGARSLVARRSPSAVCSLLHFPSSHLDWPLASTLPCGVPTFLDRVMPGRDHPTDSPSKSSLADRVGPLVSKNRGVALSVAGEPMPPPPRPTAGAERQPESG